MFLGPSSTQHQESTKNHTPVCSPRVLLTFNGEVTAVQHLPCLQFSKASHRVPGTPAAAVTWSQEPAQNSSGPLATAGCEHTHTQRPREAQPLRFGAPEQAPSDGSAGKLVGLQLSEIDISTQRLLFLPPGG